MTERRTRRSNTQRRLLDVFHGQIREHRVDIIDGQPTDEARMTLEQLGQAPAFTGETLTCAICGLTEKTDPNVETNWRVIDTTDCRQAFCPNEFPPDGSPVDLFKLAFQRCFCFIQAERGYLAQSALEPLRRPIDWRKSSGHDYGADEHDYGADERPTSQSD